MGRFCDVSQGEAVMAALVPRQRDGPFTGLWKPSKKVACVLGVVISNAIQEHAHCRQHTQTLD